MSRSEAALPCEPDFEPDYDDLSEEVQELARQELGESRETRACAVKELTDMINDQEDMTPYRKDEIFLIRFLRAKHLDVKASHQLLANYYNFKKNNPKLYKGVNPTNSKLLQIFVDQIVSVLPHRDQLRRRIVIYKMKKWNPSNLSIDEILKASLLVLELSVLEQRTQIFGGVCLFDMEGLTMRQAVQVTPKVASNILQLMGRGFPIRLREVHILNQPKIFDVVYGIFKPFLDEKMRARVFFHGRNYEAFHSYIEPKYLPEVYGGNRPSFHVRDWFENLLTFPILIKELSSLGYSVATKDAATLSEFNERTRKPNTEHQET